MVMRVPIVAMVLVVVAVGLGLAAEPAEVAFYQVRQCETAPVMDGRLDDAAWQAAPVMDHFYKYWTPAPQPPPLQTEARLCWDDRGLYLGITMLEEQLDQVRANVQSRDDPQTWHDDCVEIMIDPHNTGTGYYKFTTNLNAARHDQKATNMVLDDGWSVEGWQVATSRGEGAWFIELFVPWADLQARPREGDIWSFDLVRYGWATGGFKGVSWSLGGAGAAPQKFGYLRFGKTVQTPPQKLDPLARIVRQTKGDEFRILSEGVVLQHGRSGWLKAQSLREWLQGAQAEAEAGLAEARQAVDRLAAGKDRERLEKATTELTDQAAEIERTCDEGLKPGPALLAYHDLLAVRRKASEVKWEAMVLGLVAGQ
jgi:hypothetical protein